MLAADFLSSLTRASVVRRASIRVAWAAGSVVRRTLARARQTADVALERLHQRRAFVVRHRCILAEHPD